MTPSLYDIDALAWSEQQVGLLRRIAEGERLAAVDWPSVIEEIGPPGRPLPESPRVLNELLVRLAESRAEGTCP